MRSKFPIIKKLDDAGRFVIPTDLRKMYGFKANEQFLIFLDDKGFFVKPMPKEEKTD